MHQLPLFPSDDADLTSDTFTLLRNGASPPPSCQREQRGFSGSSVRSTQTPVLPGAAPPIRGGGVVRHHATAPMRSYRIKL